MTSRRQTKLVHATTPIFKAMSRRIFEGAQIHNFALQPPGRALTSRQLLSAVGCKFKVPPQEGRLSAGVKDQWYGSIQSHGRGPTAVT